MATSNRAPKQWSLGKLETVTSFESWRNNQTYILSLDPEFAPFLLPGMKWSKASKLNTSRTLLDDPETVPLAKRRTKEQKVTSLHLMLGQIANFVPTIARKTIIDKSTSIESVWQAIRMHYGFQTSGAHFLDLMDITLEHDERPEDLYQRLVAFIDDNLLRKENNISHCGEKVDNDEEASPTVENLVVLMWLRLVHPGLPKLVKQKYATELRTKTIASIKPEISSALDSLLAELHSSHDAHVMFSRFRKQDTHRFPKPQKAFNSAKPRRASKSCVLCKEAHRNDNHYLSECTYLPENDRKFMLKTRQIASIISQECEEDSTSGKYSDEEEEEGCVPVAYRVKISPSPYIDAFYHHVPLRITIDTGATGNTIRQSFARHLGLKVQQNNLKVQQADGSSTLSVVGETSFSVQHGQFWLRFEGLVVENLDVDILAGTPFMEENDIAVRPAMHEVTIGNELTVKYGSKEKTPAKIRSAHILRAPKTSTVVWPGEYLELDIPDEVMCEGSGTSFALEPRLDTASTASMKSSRVWPPPMIIESVAGKIRVPNTSNEPQVLKRHQQFCQIRQTSVVPKPCTTKSTMGNDCTTRKHTGSTPTSKFSSSVSVDPDNILTIDQRNSFIRLHEEYDDVFNPRFLGYNGASGPFEANVNMGPSMPPQRKGRVPEYSNDKLKILQSMFDDLEDLGVFARPEDVNVNVEYVSPSFLVGKGNGKFRLVTAFTDVGRYSKPQPSLLPDTNSVLRQISQWKYIIMSDLTNAFYQIPMSRESMKYCGVVTPFKGTRVYTRAAMGIPGSETALEELMCRILGDQLMEGTVLKLADDLFCGGNTPNEALGNWRKVLHALSLNGLCLSASKTIICPKSASILGWTWSLGTLKASPHRISALSTCDTPTTVKGMRSFVGAYKVLSRVLPKCSSLLAPLEDATAGKTSSDTLEWTVELACAFDKARAALKSNKIITLPRRDDYLWIVTDGSVKQNGMGATLYVTRGDNIHLAGFFSSKMPKQRVNWLPCEVEALSISAATKHFAPYIVQSSRPVCILTDSKPCVQAYEKLARGEFSTSPRVYSFLSTASRYQASIRHLAGTANVPSDFGSRNAAECSEPTCQICQFVSSQSDSVVRNISVEDIAAGRGKMPFTTRSTWLALQEECSDIRRTKAHLRQGTRPSKKATNIGDVKRYLNKSHLASDGLLVVRQNEPLAPCRDAIVVPRSALHGLLVSLHIQLGHPTKHQMKLVVKRYFHALDLDMAIDKVCESCFHCSSLRSFPHHAMEQSTGDPPETIGSMYAADVMKRERQNILVLREYASSYTSAMIIESEKSQCLRDAILQMCLHLKPLSGPPATVRVDAASSFRSLENDQFLHKHKIALEIGRVKNKNKNPVAEKAIQELETELLHLQPSGGIINPVTLTIATATLNARIRANGLSSREIWTHRDQFTNEQIPVSDLCIIQQKQQQRESNHIPSERSKAKGCPRMPATSVQIGDLVHIIADKNKTAPRDRYLVSAINGEWCSIHKFTGTQLRSNAYKVKSSEVYKVPAAESPPALRYSPLEHEYDHEEVQLQDAYVPPPTPPDIPTTLSAPPTDAEPCEPPTSVNTPPEVISSPVQDSASAPLPSNVQASSPNRTRSGRAVKKPGYLLDYIT